MWLQNRHNKPQQKADPCLTAAYEQIDEAVFVLNMAFPAPLLMKMIYLALHSSLQRPTAIFAHFISSNTLVQHEGNKAIFPQHLGQRQINN